MGNDRDFRKDFPLLANTMNGKPLVYLDNGATTQKPESVIQAMCGYYGGCNANPHRGAYELSVQATDIYENARKRTQQFIHAASSQEIIFTKNATEALNLVAYSYGLANIQAGDEIVITIAEHHSNLVPWQQAAHAKGAVLNKFAGMNRNVTEVVGFANVMDFYDWLGDKEITVQTMFGLQYIKDFFGFSTLFLLPDDYIPAKTVIATPVENIDLYYIDPGDSDFKKLGLDYTTSGETNLIGFHAGGNYTNATGETYAIMGMKLWAEYLDGVCVVTVGTTETIPEVSSAVSEVSSNGK